MNEAEYKRFKDNQVSFELVLVEKRKSNNRFNALAKMAERYRARYTLSKGNLKEFYWKRYNYYVDQMLVENNRNRFLQQILEVTYARL